MNLFHCFECLLACSTAEWLDFVHHVALVVLLHAQHSAPTRVLSAFANKDQLFDTREHHLCTPSRRHCSSTRGVRRTIGIRRDRCQKTRSVLYSRVLKCLEVTGRGCGGNAKSGTVSGYAEFGVHCSHSYVFFH